MQNTKFIDVTRSYIPIDVNSFPHGLHGAEREGLPENRIPVSAYKGYNFLPTSYGYKSYFGTNSQLGIDALAARVDHVILYQNQNYENVLIALCDTGIWIKKGEVAGAWTQALVIAEEQDPNIWFEWTYCIISNVLYCYRQGAANYQKIEPDVVNGVTVTSVVPNFLNMAGQVGIFKANGRLGFWDTEDSFAWSNLDDFADFTPSLETLAGNAKFIELQGRTVTVRSHGPGFMIYATKSILFVQNDPESTYRWRPQIVSSNSGIAYPRQSAMAEPDTVHFAWTSEGLKKIENARPEVIVPEVTDFFQDYEKPIYLKVLGNRYLFLEVIDEAYITGRAQFSTVDIPPTDFTFPAVELDIDAQNPESDYLSQCAIVDGFDNGNFGAVIPPPADSKPSTLMRPIWAAYLSRNGILIDEPVVWVDGPCNVTGPDGVAFSFTPDQGQLSKLSADETNKTPVLGSEAYIDGNWTITRFIQTQMAIWEAEAKTKNNLIEQILNRARVASGATLSASSAPVASTRSECAVTQVGAQYSPPLFGYSKCEFWLTRFAISAIDVKRVRADNYVVEDTFPGPEDNLMGYTANVSGINTGGPFYASAAAALDAAGYTAANGWSFFSENTATGYTYYGAGGGGLANIAVEQGVLTRVKGFTTISADAIYNSISGRFYASAGASIISHNSFVTGLTRRTIASPRYKITQNMFAYNKGIEVPITPVQDTAFCKIIGYKYTKNDDTEGTVMLSGPGCVAPTSYPNVSGTRPGKGKLNINLEDGSYCSAPFEGAIIDSVEVNWPAQTVTLPGGSFFLQQGSIAPLYPTFTGALVYDLFLKKWGKMKLRYKQLLDYSPLNSTASGNVPVNNFGIMAGALTADGKISLFDQYPSDSYITYGKIGYYRQGYTSMEEAHVQFATPGTGYMKVEVSLEGEALSAGLEKTVEFTDETKASVYGIYAGKWCNIEIGGIYDIKYLEYRGYTQGRR